MTAGVTTRQAGESKKMAEARLSFDENFNTDFSFLKMCIHLFGTPCISRRKYTDSLGRLPGKETKEKIVYKRLVLKLKNFIH